MFFKLYCSKVIDLIIAESGKIATLKVSENSALQNGDGVEKIHFIKVFDMEAFEKLQKYIKSIKRIQIFGKIKWENKSKYCIMDKESEETFDYWVPEFTYMIAKPSTKKPIPIRELGDIND